MIFRSLLARWRGWSHSRAAAILLSLTLAGCTSASPQQNPVAMSATVTAMWTATAAVPTPVPQATVTPAPRASAAAATGGTDVTIVEPPFRPPQTWTYDPQELAVKVGAKVIWTNTGGVAHTVTADQGSAFDSG